MTEPDTHKIVSKFRTATDSSHHTAGTLKMFLEYLLPDSGEPPWREFKNTGGLDRVYHYETFEAFLKMWSKLTLSDLRKLFCDDASVLNRLDKATQKGGGERTDLVDNIHEVQERPAGTSKDAALRRLRKDRPDLLERVLDGEVSAHGAMIEAGFRKKTVAVVPTAEGYAASIEKHLPGYKLVRKD